MGNGTCSSEESFETRFKSKYEFISLVNDENFGEVKIYRKKELNFDYVMVLQKYIQNSKLNSLVREVQAIHGAFLQQNEPMALRIFNFDTDLSTEELNKGEITNCSLSVVKIFVEYFNYTLGDLIQAHQMKGDSFSYEELIYIVHSTAATYYQFFGTVCNNIDLTKKNLIINSKSMYLTPEGCLKFCPIRPQEFFQHSNPMCNTFCNETVYKEITNFERGQKYLITQLKRIFMEISELKWGNSADSKKIEFLFEELSKCQIIEHFLQKIGKPNVDFLNVTHKNEGSTVEENKPESRSDKTNSMITKKPFSDFSEKKKSNESESIKLSLTKSQPKA